MTVHEIKGVSDPCIHALVIGVGTYQNCGKAAPLRASGRRLLKELETPLPCAPLSAVHVARWLIEAGWDASTVKLGTIEVLLSSDSPSPWPADLPRLDPKPALYDNVRTAWQGWVDRCNGDPGNIALLYFCGHGWGGSQHYLLVEDFAAEISTWPDRVIDFNRTRDAMLTCNALTQCFFLDVCSNEPAELGSQRINPHNLIDENPDEAVLRKRRKATTPNNPVLRPAPNGFASRVPPGEPTPYAQALVKTLNGLGATFGTDNAWEIRTRSLPVMMAEVLDWFWPELGDDLNPTAGDCARNTVLRHCPDIPMVPFRLDCHPHSARPSADWELECLQTGVRHPRPEPGVWEAETEASSYRITANWNHGTQKTVTLEGVPILPACRLIPIRFN